MGLTKRHVRRAKTPVNLRNCTFWSEHSLIVLTCTFASRAVQSGINSVTVTSHSDQILRWSYSMHLLRTPGYPRSLLYIVSRCTDWPECLLVARTSYYSTFCRLVHCKNIVNHTSTDVILLGRKKTHSLIWIVISLSCPLCAQSVFFVFTWAVLLIQCLFDSRSAPLSWLILTRAVAAPEWEFPGLLP